jgi:hypothetical protein
MIPSENTGSQSRLVEKLHQVGWLIPPYVSVARIHQIASIIEVAGTNFGQQELEQVLSALFTPEILATMVLNRYPQTKVIQDFQTIIGEGVAAHFLKLDHIAASGLVPVVEGATRRLAERQGLEARKFLPTLSALVEHCKTHVRQKRIGAVGEILSMLDSFEMFLSKVLFVNTDDYAFTDGTNRHGMAHGLFADAAFGSPLNFYKILTATNFLTFMSALYYGGSGFVPDETPQSLELARHYHALRQIASGQPTK